jgi:type IV pilus assembly protein PilC
VAIFTYTARDTTGKTRTGTVDARSESSAFSLLKEQGLFVVSIQERKTSILDSFTSAFGIPETEVVSFTRQFSTMVSAGLPISRALDVLSQQSSNKNFRKILLDALRDLEGGSSLAASFGKFPRVFSPTYQALVGAGEASGKLDQILLRLADTMEADRDLKSKFRSAMIYPAIIFLAMIGVFVLMMVYVVPKLADMYDQMDVDLPFMTEMMIDISNFMVARWYVVILLAAGVGLGFKAFLSTDMGTRTFSIVAFNMPVFGKINKQKEFAQFSRTLSLLIGSAIPIVDALNIVSRVVKNNTLRRASIEAARNVEKGNALSEYFRYNKVFPPLLAQMASVGEETGELDAVLGRVADFFSGETDHAVKGLSSALEPLILILLGGMVGLLIVSIITPIYKITTSI